MNFNPQSEQELEEDRRKRMKILKKGEADFVVKTAKNAISKNNDEMIEMQVECTDADGMTKVVRDWLHPAMPHRIRHFCYATGLGSIYERGELDAEHCGGRGGRCMIQVEHSEQYGDQNKIKDYVVADQTKGTTGYQNAKNSNGAGPQHKPEPTEAEKAKRRAWDNFKSKFPEVQTAELQGEFKKAVADYFPAKKIELIGAGEWDRFVKDGFVKDATSPIGDEAVFAESDIPF
jgi:hypothetical protein